MHGVGNKDLEARHMRSGLYLRTPKTATIYRLASASWADAEVPTKPELDAWVVNARKSAAFSYQARDVRMGRPNAAQPAEPCALEIRTVRSQGMLTRIASTPPAFLHGAQTGETSPRLEERRRARSCAPRSRVLLASRAQSPRRVDSRNCEGG